MLNSVTPFFIVDDLGATVAFYQSKLGFDVLHHVGDGNGSDFRAIVGRDRGNAHVQGHHARHPSTAESFAPQNGLAGTPTF
jgi:catechol 2,3-dioxygenase-like lactoylglutathione lyase family enzyme